MAFDSAAVLGAQILFIAEAQLDHFLVFQTYCK